MQLKEIIPGLVTLVIAGLFVTIFPFLNFYDLVTLFIFWAVMDMKYND